MGLLDQLLGRKRKEPHALCFCVACKCEQLFDGEPSVRQTSNGKRQLSGRCAVCGTRMHRFVASESPPKPRKVLPVVRVEPVTKQRLVEACEFTGATQAEIVDHLVGRGLDSFVLDVARELIKTGRQLTKSEYYYCREARGRLDGKPWRPELQTDVELEIEDALFPSWRRRN